jgi:hypothetical protein
MVLNQTDRASDATIHARPIARTEHACDGNNAFGAPCFAGYLEARNLTIHLEQSSFFA